MGVGCCLSTFLAFAQIVPRKGGGAFGVPPPGQLYLFDLPVGGAIWDLSRGWAMGMDFLSQYSVGW